MFRLVPRLQIATQNPSLLQRTGGNRTSSYKLIKPPYPLRFREMDRAKAREYFSWFQNQISTRCQVLTEYVHTFIDYGNWESNFTVNSLDLLGEWLCKHVTTRKRSQEEMGSIYSYSPEWFKSIQVPDYDLSISSASLCIDIGMYLGQVMILTISGLHWKLITKPIRSIDFQQPVLIGQGKVAFNPVRLVMVYAYGCIDGTRGSEGLREIYEIWSNLLRE